MPPVVSQGQLWEGLGPLVTCLVRVLLPCAYSWEDGCNHVTRALVVLMVVVPGALLSALSDRKCLCYSPDDVQEHKGQLRARSLRPILGIQIRHLA